MGMHESDSNRTGSPMSALRRPLAISQGFEPGRVKKRCSILCLQVQLSKNGHGRAQSQFSITGHVHTQKTLFERYLLSRRAEEIPSSLPGKDFRTPITVRRMPDFIVTESDKLLLPASETRGQAGLCI